MLFLPDGNGNTFIVPQNEDEVEAQGRAYLFLINFGVFGLRGVFLWIALLVIDVFAMHDIWIPMLDVVPNSPFDVLDLMEYAFGAMFPAFVVMATVGYIVLSFFHVIG